MYETKLFWIVEVYFLRNNGLLKLICFVLDSRNHAWINVIQLVYKGRIIRNYFSSKFTYISIHKMIWTDHRYWLFMVTSRYTFFFGNITFSYVRPIEKKTENILSNIRNEFPLTSTTTKIKYINPNKGKCALVYDKKWSMRIELKK